MPSHSVGYKVHILNFIHQLQANPTHHMLLLPITSIHQHWPTIQFVTFFFLLSIKCNFSVSYIRKKRSIHTYTRSSTLHSFFMDQNSIWNPLPSAWKTSLSNTCNVIVWNFCFAVFFYLFLKCILSRYGILIGIPTPTTSTLNMSFCCLPHCIFWTWGVHSDFYFCFLLYYLLSAPLATYIISFINAF